MKNMRLSNLKHFAFLLLAILLITSCDKEYTSLDSDIVSSGSTNFSTDVTDMYPVTTYTKTYSPFTSNNLSSNSLGFYSHPIFGTTKTDVVAQVSASSLNPTFGENVELDSVVLTIPYYSRITELSDDNTPIYKLDSIFGSDPIKLSIYRNNYFLRDFDPNEDFSDARKYYSDGSTSDFNSISENELQGQLLYQNDAFIPNNEIIYLTELNYEINPPETDTTSTLRPSLRIKLDNNLGEDNFEALNQYWKNILFDLEGSTELSNINNFTNYFRGLYFKTESIDGKGNMSLLNFRDPSANLTVYYKNTFDDNDDDNDGVPNYADVDADGDGINENGDDTDGDGINDVFDVDQTDGYDNNGDGIDDSIRPTTGLYQMNLSGNILNLVENNGFNVVDGDQTNGDELLYLKGGLGSIAVINLFNGGEDGESIELADFRSKNWLINEANLIFYVDQSQMLEDEPDRVFIYDLENKIPLADFNLNQSIDPETGKAVVNHLGPLERVDDDPDGQGISYKLRITEHLKNIHENDSTNVKLGLFVTSGVSDVQRLELKDFDENNANFQIENIISATVLTPKGTILHGSNSTDPEKRVKLQIYYTEPNN